MCNANNIKTLSFWGLSCSERLKKGTLILFLAIVALVAGTAGIFAVASEASASVDTVPAVSASVDGITFSAYETYDTALALSNAPRTVEAIVKFHTGGGVIFSNYENDAVNYVCFAITENGSPKISANGYDHELSSVSLKEEFAFIAFVLSDEETDVYVNGKKVGTMETLVLEDFEPTVFRVGGDYRTTGGYNSNYFRGNVRALAVYSDARNAAEIQSDYMSQTVDGALVAYDFTKESTFYAQNDTDWDNNVSFVTTCARDYSGNGNNLVYGKGGVIAPTTGLEFSSAKAFDSVQSEVVFPQSVEAVIFVPNDSNRGGVIYGNYSDLAKPGLNFEIYSNGNPRIYYVGANGYVLEILFNSVNVRYAPSSTSNPLWRAYVHVGFVLDTTNKIAQCYVNGGLAASIVGNPNGNATERALYYTEFSTEGMEPFRVGGD